jgi:hypothetical protein
MEYEILKLYRGDKLQSSTEPGRYRFDGIRSKSFGQGIPKYIAATALLGNIRQHIRPESPEDDMIYNATEFISFSSLKARAFEFMRGPEFAEVKPEENDYEETRYLFELTINTGEMLPIDDYQTMFKYYYNCNYNLKEANSISPLERLMLDVTPAGTYAKSCPICNNMTVKGHVLVLIDAVKYLNHYKSGEAFEGAIGLAENDREWLVLPTDKSGNFSGTTIPRAGFWDAHLYKGIHDVRTGLEHQIQGIMYDENGDVTDSWF